LKFIETSPEVVNKKNDPKYSQIVKETLDILEFIYSMKKENLVNVFKLDENEDFDDKGIENAIINAIFNCKYIQSFYFFIQ
jgi:hypothetical protein